MADTKTAAESNEAYAIVEASGTQVWVQPNRYYDLDRLQADVDATNQSYYGEQALHFVGLCDESGGVDNQKRVDDDR